MEVLLLCLALGANESKFQPIEVRVERIELNHIVRISVAEDGRGGWQVSYEKAFDYWNLWGWHGFPDYDFHVREWDAARQDHLLVREAGEYVLYARGHDYRRFRIRSAVFVETWTIHDPEREDAELFPINRRQRIVGFRPDSQWRVPLDPFGPVMR